jgi:hypothetical protein
MLRKISAIIAAMLACGAVTVFADGVTVTYVAKLSGQIQTATTKQTITQANFVASTNLLLVEIDLDHGVFALVEASGSTTNPQASLIVPSHTAVFTNHNAFEVTLVPNGAPVALQNGLVFGGELLSAGTVTVSKGVAKSFQATLSGIWNDPILGNTNAPAAFFKGTLSGKAVGP